MVAIAPSTSMFIASLSKGYVCNSKPRSPAAPHFPNEICAPSAVSSTVTLSLGLVHALNTAIFATVPEVGRTSAYLALNKILASSIALLSTSSKNLHP